MKGSQYILIGTLALLIISSCASNEKWNDIHTVKVAGQAKAEKQDNTDEEGEPTIVPTYDIVVNMEFMDTTSIENHDACMTINNHIIREFLDQQDETDGTKAVETFIERLQNQYVSDEMSQDMYDHYIGKAEFGCEGIINYILCEDFYGGGAHPTAVTSIMRFDTNTGNKIGLREFFTDTCTASLCDRLTQRLMENIGVPTLDSLHSLGYLDMLDMFVSENFLLRKDSVSFFYNQYDIAPYSKGTTTISFSYDELKDLIRK